MRRLYPLDPEYARQLAERRRSVGLSQNAVALAVGVAEATIGKYERLAAPVPPPLRESIDRALSAAEQSRASVPA